MKSPIEIQTERLWLRQWRVADFAPFADLNSDPLVMEYFPATLDRDESNAMARRLHDLIDARGWGLWAVEVRDSGAFAGFVGLNDVPSALPFSPAIEIGWRLAHAHWGRGYASEAARAALRVAFETIGLEEVVSFTSVVNTRSRTVMEKVGLRYASAFEHPTLPDGSPLREHCLYQIDARAWRAAARS